MKKLFLITILSLALLPVMAQQHKSGQHCGNCPQHQAQTHQPRTINGIAAEIVKVFPDAKGIQTNGKWIAVYDSYKKLLGYVVYSKPESNGIVGYNGETPLLIAFTPKQKILSVTLLHNKENTNYLNRITEAGLLKSWDGLKVKKARKKKVDTVSGATYSSRSIIQSLQAVMKAL